MRKGHLYYMNAFMKLWKAFHIINTTIKENTPTMSNYNEVITFAQPKNHLCIVKLESHNTNSTSVP